MSQQSNSTEPLRYPYSRMSDRQNKVNSDFLKINIIRYKKSTVGSDLFDASASAGNIFNLPSASERYGVDRFSGFVDPNIAELIKTIFLPIPQSIQDSNGVKWGEDTLNPFASAGLQAAGQVMERNYTGALKSAKAAADVIGDTAVGSGGRNLTNLFFGSRIVNTLGGNTSFQGLVSRTSGQVLNPNLELLFNGVSLRSFSFDFDFVPRYERESQEVRTIIRTLKKHMNAKGAGEGGLFIKSPDIFSIRYVTGEGEAHEYLNLFKPMALKNMSVNYTGSGTYATYENTSPVHLKMNLQFQEIDPIYSEDYDVLGLTGEQPSGTGGAESSKNYYDPRTEGVGY